MLQILSSAAVVIGALRVNVLFSLKKSHKLDKARTVIAITRRYFNSLFKLFILNNFPIQFDEIILKLSNLYSKDIYFCPMFYLSKQCRP